MSNRDRLLQFLYDSQHARVEYLADLKKAANKFYMTRYDNEDLVYVAYGGTGAFLFVFGLRGRFKYKAAVTLDTSLGKNSRRLPGRTGDVPSGNDGQDGPTLIAHPE